MYNGMWFSFIHVAYWIAYKAVKLVYDIEDNLKSLPQNTSGIDVLRDTVYGFFNVSTYINIKL